jgi:hypothetical protein
MSPNVIDVDICDARETLLYVERYKKGRMKVPLSIVAHAAFRHCAEDVWWKTNRFQHSSIDALLYEPKLFERIIDWTWLSNRGLLKGTRWLGGQEWAVV